MRRRPSRRLRLGAGLIASLVSGAVLTVLVSWVVSYRTSAPPEHGRSVGCEAIDGHLLSLQVERFASAGYECLIERAARAFDQEQPARSLPSDAYPWWDGVARMFEVVRTQWNGVTRTTVHTRFAFASGWPIVALAGERGHLTAADGTHADISDGDELRIDLTKLPRLGLARTFVFLPIRPIWPGFILDTMFYAGIIAIPTFGMPALRRWRRRRSDRCEACGYGPLVSGACAECGTAASWRLVDREVRTLQPAEP